MADQIILSNSVILLRVINLQNIYEGMNTHQNPQVIWLMAFIVVTGICRGTRKRIFIVAYVLATFILINVCCAQSEAVTGPAKQSIIQELEIIQNSLDPSHYGVEMHFKEMGGDTFEIKRFNINYRSNATNPLYGYDYEITEIREEDTRTIMAMNSSRFVIITGSKKIFQSPLPAKVHYGSYFYNIRSNYIISEVLHPFLNAPPDDLTIKDSCNSYYIKLRINDAAERKLVVDKTTKLPVMWSSVIKTQDFDLVQILSVHFSYPQYMSALPRDAFSIEQYLSGGFEHIVHEPDSSGNLAIETVVSINSQELLNYAFVSAQEDTIHIHDYSAGYVLLDFWFASCLPCLNALPELNRLAGMYSELEVLAINCIDEGIKENLSIKMKEKGIDIPLLFGTRDILDSMGISSFPTYYILTPDRELMAVNGGIEDIKTLLGKLIND